MSLTYGFYNSVNGDRKYNAKQMAAIFDGIITNGVFMSIGDAFVVLAESGMNISVGTGRAWFNGTWTDNDSDIVLTLDAAEVILDRIDLVVLEINTSNDVRSNSIKVIKGTPASSPVAPTLIKNDTVNQYPFASIYVKSGTTVIVQSMITNKIGTPDCPFTTGILETVNIGTLLGQWQSQFEAWFDGVENTLSGDVAGNLLTKINEKVTIGTSTIFKANWTAQGNIYKNEVSIAGITSSNWVDVTIGLDYQDIIQKSGFYSVVEEYAGMIRFYSSRIPSSDIPIRYKVVR